jgi:1-deoxy-D-xylulose-5-phosphate synthase
MLLDSISGPDDVRALHPDQLAELAAEIRTFIVQAVARTGGHLGSNLGAVELAIALHRAFDSPHDIILWDTGHQAYVHKILTGRAEGFSGLRQSGGLSGYPSRAESEHDWVENSHASTSLSWAHGLATALQERGEDDRHVVAVIGDGSMTGGMAYEALNNLGHSGRRAVIVLNDNGRSYAPTVSRLTENVVRLRLDPRYLRGREVVGKLLNRVPMGGTVKRGIGGASAAMRELFEPPVFFETLGVRYVGPIDGHDIATLESALRAAAEHDGPIVVHVLTTKGLGYEPAERDAEKHLHDTGLFDPATGEAPKRAWPDFTKAFSEVVVDEGARRPELVAITAAMPGSTGLLPFGQRFPDRCFDVGIAEQHAVTMAAGLAAGGLRPVVALYSTFLARAVDQVLYDVALHELPVVFCVDRAGVTGPDGASHHGLFDIALMSRVPGMRILAPSSYQELQAQFRTALEVDDGPVMVRWPRGTAPQIDEREVGIGWSARQLRSGHDVCLIGAGRLVWAALEAADLLAAQGVSASVWDPRALRPIDPVLLEAAVEHELIVTVEDGVREGGFGTAVRDQLADADLSAPLPPVLALGAPSAFLPHGEAGEILSDLGLDPEGIAASTFKHLRDGQR